MPGIFVRKMKHLCGQTITLGNAKGGHFYYFDAETGYNWLISEEMVAAKIVKRE